MSCPTSTIPTPPDQGAKRSMPPSTFVTDVPFTIKQAGLEASSFPALRLRLHYLQTTQWVVTTDNAQDQARSAGQNGCAPAAKGWVENFKGPGQPIRRNSPTPG